MITRFHIENFKSLENFTLPPKAEGALDPFTCLIGLNGAGKSTLLQAFDFISHLIDGDVSEWLKSRDWKKTELTNFADPKRKLIDFKLNIELSSCDFYLMWKGTFNTNLLRCTDESIVCNGETILKLHRGVISISDKEGNLETRWQKTSIKFEGSVMSVVNMKDEHPAFTPLIEFLQNIKSLELLAPHLMRKRAKSAIDIGVGGERLSAFLDSLASSEKEAFITEVKNLYPNFINLKVQTLRAGWKNLQVFEADKPNTGIDAKHLNDGLLRILAIIAQAHSDHTFLLFDEIENGMNPEVVEKIVDFLITLGSKNRQVMVTTHSPLILNFIPDEIAIKNIILIYKDKRGMTQCKRFFDIPGMQNQLMALGPGEVLVDTNLTELVANLAEDSEK